MPDTSSKKRRLTELVACAGWASKLAAGELAQVLSDLPAQTDPRILVDFRTADDAGVYRWDERSALVQTVDFFTPIVDDPFVYGQIAAANALSDIYAMGARPLTALAIAGFPDDEVGPETMRLVFLGGYDKLREAGVALLGGHTVRDPELKFGYAVTGVVDPARVLTNAGARPGDALVLTKGLGTGIAGTAIKFGRAPENMVGDAVRSMTTLNKAGAEVLSGFGGAVHGCTDITGFGLVGHACEVAVASRVTLEFRTAALPLLAGVLALAANNRSRGMESNREHFADRVGAEGVDQALLDVCFDPQTSGGLLIAVEPGRADALVSALHEAGVQVARVGDVLSPGPHQVRLRAD